MRKLFTIMSSAALAVAALLPNHAGAQTAIKERVMYQNYDSQGAGGPKLETTRSYYTVDGKIARKVKWHKDYGTNVLTPSYKTNYVYDDAGRLVSINETKARATSPDNVDNTFVFDNNRLDTYVYTTDGLLYETYYQQYASDKIELRPAKLYRSVYTYNADGTVNTETYWMNYTPTATNPDPKPSRTTTYVYGNQGTNPVSSTTRGQYASNCWDTDYEYDASGHLVRQLSIKTTVDGESTGKTKELKEWTYDGDFLVSVVTTNESGQKSGTFYTKLNGNPLAFSEDNGTWYPNADNPDTGSWKYKAFNYDHYKQDYAGTETLVPTIVSATVTAEDASNVSVKFTMPGELADGQVVNVFRDGVPVKVLDKAALAELLVDGQYVFVDAGLENGNHEYYANVASSATPDTNPESYTEGYISSIVSVEVAKEYPSVTDLTIKGYILTKTWIPEQTDEDTGEVYEGYFDEQYELVLSWTPVNADEVADLGFKGYMIYAKTKFTPTSYPQASDQLITDITASTATIEWRKDSWNGLYIETRYAAENSKTEIIDVDLTQLPNLSPNFPVVYGAMNDAGYGPIFSKIDLAKPGDAAEELYNLFQDSGIDCSKAIGGVAVGNKYYTYLDGGDFAGPQLTAIDMTNKAYKFIGEAREEGPESRISGMAYDSSSKILYGVEPKANASALYTIDLTTGNATLTDIAVPAYTLYLASTDNGIIYAMAQESGKFQLYTIDTKQKSSAKVEGVTIDGTSNTWSSLTRYDNSLYFTNSTKFYSVNLDDNTVTTNNNLKKAVSGLVFAMSSELPEDGASLDGDARLLTKEVKDGVTTEYFYNRNNQLYRVAKTDANGLVEYTRNTYTEAGVLASTTVSKPVADEYGVESLTVTMTTEYTYTNDGQLAAKTNSDGTWVRYTYDAAGRLETESYGNGETTERLIEYGYEDETSTLPCEITSSTPGVTDRPEDVYYSMLQYDERGNKEAEIRFPDRMSAPTCIYIWQYYEGTDIVYIEGITGPDGMTPVHMTYYIMVDDDPMHIQVQSIDPEIGPDAEPYDLYYSNLTTKQPMSVFVMPTDGGINSVDVYFTLPTLAYSKDVHVAVYRNGLKLKEFTAADLAESTTYTDELVPNGEYEYFVQCMVANTGGETYTGLQISEAAPYEFALTLPAVTDIEYVAAEVKYTDAEGNLTEETTGTPVNVVTIRWANPTYPADYGFKGNTPYIVDGETPVAGETVADAAAVETTINFGAAKEADVMVQTVYALGVAKSTPAHIVVENSLSEISSEGFSVSVVDKTVIASDTADIRVFDVTGKQLAAANAARLSLADFDGTVLVAVTYNGTVRVLKVVL